MWACSAACFAKAIWFKFRPMARPVGRITRGSLPQLRREGLADRLEQPNVVEPRHPLQRRQLPRLPHLLRAAPVDQLCLVQTVDPLGQGVVIAISTCFPRKAAPPPPCPDGPCRHIATAYGRPCSSGTRNRTRVRHLNPIRKQTHCRYPPVRNEHLGIQADQRYASSDNHKHTHLHPFLDAFTTSRVWMPLAGCHLP